MKKKLIAAAALTLLISGSTIPLSLAQEDRTAGTQPKNENSHSDTYKQLNLFGEVFERVRSEYVEEKNDKDIIENALNGMLSSLDPHSSYLNEERFKDMKVETRGQFGGLGIEVTMESGFVKVVSPIDDTPAFRAGIEAGDFITKIDGEPVLGLTLSDAVKKMRGKVGSNIDLEIRREGEETPLDMTITRDIIRIKSVKHRTEGNVGYVRVTSFNQNAAVGVQNAISEIKEELGDKLVGFVLDLRNNPGGLLNQAVEISDIFLEQGEIVSTRGRNEDDTKRDNATLGDLTDGLPIVLLVNGGSASASEIVAGALQDHKRAIILGTKSFGKGSVQTVMPLASGNGAIRLTTARYYTPSGRSIQAKGIDPDIVVEQAKIETYESSGISEADLRGALDKKKKEKESPKAANDNKDKAGDNKEEEKQDYQLSRAIDLLTGLHLYSYANDQATK